MRFHLTSPSNLMTLKIINSSVTTAVVRLLAVAGIPGASSSRWIGTGVSVSARLPTTTTPSYDDSQWRCDHGWDIDLDDGSTNNIITNNLLLHGGLNLREGFRRIVTNNILVTRKGVAIEQVDAHSLLAGRRGFNRETSF
ncbi:MAG TPA: hypothetical protein VM842_02510 [Nitrospira sp.]|nr:hypothetical protein [Nitrospira sp.]